MSNISSSIEPSNVLEQLFSLRDNCNNLKKSIEDAENNCFSVISDKSNALLHYNGKKAPEYVKKYSFDLLETSTLDGYYVWNISVDEDIKNASSNFNSDLVLQALDDLINELTNSEIIINCIQEEINKLSNELALTAGGISAFEALRSNIFLDEYNAARNTNNVTISDAKVQYWTDEPLEFRYDKKTGSYLILQGGVGMGWTNKEGILDYYKALKNSIPQEEVIEEKEEEVIEEKEKVEDVPSTEKVEETLTPSQEGKIRAERIEKELEEKGFVDIQEYVKDKKWIPLPEGSFLRITDGWTDDLLQSVGFSSGNPYNDVMSSDAITGISYDEVNDNWYYYSGIGPNAYKSVLTNAQMENAFITNESVPALKIFNYLQTELKK